MDRNDDGSRNNDAKILAQLRRRSAASSSRHDDDFEFNRVNNADDSSGAPKNADARAEALKKLVASNAPKEPMSALSSTLRGLREELNSGDVAAYAVANDLSSGDANLTDASLDLVDAELDWRKKGKENLPQDDVPTPEEEKFFPNEENKTESTQQTVNVDLVQNERLKEEKNIEKFADSRELLVVSKLRKGYVKAKKLIPVLQGVDLTVRQGELLAVVGQSGSGKSTLLHLMGTLDVPDSGTIHFDGQRIDNLPCAQRDVLRNRFIGMIFQFYHLLPEMTTIENVLAPLMIRDSFFAYMKNRAKYIERAKELLNVVGLSHRLKHKPNELSGGEMQRASIARALITNPRVLLADEPTGNLDSKASLGVLDLMRRLNEETKLTIVMVTHDMSQARDADRAIRIVDGMVVRE